MNSINGYYKVDQEIFYNKFQALIYASKKNKDVKWIYYDDLYDNVCENIKLFDVSLEEIYKKRAIQLREKYDYIILNYSGGSDSHNILQTFLKNNIQLDMIFIQWPTSLMDKNLYLPNVIDKSNFNFHSEWDFVIKKDIEWLSKYHPDIKIEIADWAQTIDLNFYNDELFENNVTNLPSIARSQKQNTFSKTESVLSNKGLKVASIFGVDKPAIGIKDNNFYFRMADTSCMAHVNPENPTGLEYFYYTPDMPEIPVIQCYKMYQHYIKNPNIFYMKTDLKTRLELYPHTIHDSSYDDLHNYWEVFKSICYPHWDFSRFQAEKPFSVLSGLPVGVRAWDNILIKSIPDFKKIQQKWQYLWKSYHTMLDTKFLLNQDTVDVIFTKWHKLKI
jgi:hypothetical protein